jgi:hypothetical protein
LAGGTVSRQIDRPVSSRRLLTGTEGIEGGVSVLTPVQGRYIPTPPPRQPGGLARQRNCGGAAYRMRSGPSRWLSKRLRWGARERWRARNESTKVLWIAERSGRIPCGVPAYSLRYGMNHRR